MPGSRATARLVKKPGGPAIADLPYEYQVHAQDAENDPITFRLESPPDGMAIDEISGLLTWIPALAQVRSQHVAITASDGRGGEATQIFNLPVVAAAPNDPPGITSTPRYSIRWTPTTDQIGSQDVVVRVIDGQGGSSAQTYAITVRPVNVPPGITSAPPTRAFVEETYSYAVRATDPEDDPLTFSLTTAPAGMSIDPNTGYIEWVPELAQVDGRDVEILVEDGQGGHVMQDYTVVVSDTASNEYPVITSTAPSYAPVGEVYQYQVTATDPDGDPLEFLLLPTVPSGMIVDTTVRNEYGEYGGWP